MRLGNWVVAAKRPFVTARKLSSHRGRAVTLKENGCCERNRSREESGTGLCRLSEIACILLLRIVVVV